MPLQATLATVFEGRRLAHFDHRPSPGEYARQQFLSLQSARTWWRSLAAASYLLGAALAFFIGLRTLGSWGLGLAAGLLWIGAPGLAERSIQYRPDVPFAVAALAVVLLAVEGAKRRSAGLYTASALAVGFAMTVKVNAVSLVPVPVLAAAWRPPPAGWFRDMTVKLRRLRKGFWLGTGCAAAAWLALIWDFNRGRPFPPQTTSEEQRLVFGTAAVLTGYGAFSLFVRRTRAPSAFRRLFDPLYLVLACAVVVGIAVPATLFFEDALSMAVHMEQTLRGGGVNEGLQWFAFSGESFGSWPLKQALLVAVIGAAGALVAATKRDYSGMLWMAGAIGIGVTAASHGGAVNYWGPAYVLAVPPALMLLRRRGPVTVLATVAVVAYVAVPQLQHVRAASKLARHEEAVSQAIERIGRTVLRPGQVALVDDAAPTSDSRYNAAVETFIQGAPPLQVTRFLEESPFTPEWINRKHLRLSYYIGARAVGATSKTSFFLGDAYRVRPLPGATDTATGIGVVQLLRGPGVHAPFAQTQLVRRGGQFQRAR
jgi:MFS family permease